MHHMFNIFKMLSYCFYKEAIYCYNYKLSISIVKKLPNFPTYLSNDLTLS